MTIIEDTRQQSGKHEKKHKYWLSKKVYWRRTALDCGDYTLPGNSSVCIDTKKDIEELSAMFKSMLGDTEETEKEGEFIREFRTNFYPLEGFSAKYVIMIPDREATLSIEVTPKSVKCWYSDDEEADVVMKAETKVLKAILSGKNTFQRAFMAGEITAKGNFKTLRTLDQVFRFQY